MTDIHLDPDVLSALREYMEDEFSTLVDTFLTDSEERLQQLVVATDATRIFDIAHSFKGSSSNMGATHLAELCHDLEQNAKVQSVSDLGAKIAEVVREFALVRPLYEEARQHSLPAIATVRPY